MRIPVKAVNLHPTQRAVCDYLAARLGFQARPTPPAAVDLFASLVAVADEAKAETTEAPSEQPQQRKQKARR